jgi:DNA polymerase-3 subunit beta
MQMIKATRDAILKPLQTVAGIVERRHTLPILSNVLVRKTGNTVSFLASDLEIQIQTSADIGAGTDDAATTVPARKLIDILRSLPEGEIAVGLTGKKLTLAAGKSRFSLQTLAPEDFPTLAVDQKVAAELVMTQRQLKHLLSMVHFAMAQQDTNRILNGVLFVVESGHARSVATDRARLAYCATTLGNAPSLTPQQGAVKVTIPRKSVMELQRLLNDSDEPVEIRIASNQARFRFGEVEFLSKLIEGTFPDYQRVIPTGYQRAAIVNREAIAQALLRSSILSTDKVKGVRLSLSADAFKIQTTNSEQEEAMEELDVDYTGEPLEVGFNVAFLVDVIANLKSESLKFEFGDANTGGLLSVPGDSDFLYVLMPMRI